MDQPFAFASETPIVCRQPPNFSRPLPRPPERGPPRSQGIWLRPKVGEERWIKEIAATRSVSSIGQDVAGHEYNTQNTSQHSSSGLYGTRYPSDRHPVIASSPPSLSTRNLYLPQSDIPKDAGRPPEQARFRHLSRTCSFPADASGIRTSGARDDEPLPTPRPSTRMLRKIKSKLMPSHSERIPGKPKNPPAREQYRASDTKPESSWSTPAKRSLQSRLGTCSQRSATPRTPASTVSNASTSRSSCKQSYLPVNVSTTLLIPPKPFQCTFCLLQCTDKEDWLKHEQLFHFEDIERSCGRYDGVSRSALNESVHNWSVSSKPRSLSTANIQEHTSSCRSSYTSNHEEQGRMYWNCGFCDMVFCFWERRQEHLADEHFEKGETMSQWDPLKPPLPWQEGSLIVSNNRPCWDLASLLANQRLTLMDSINRVGDTQKQRYTCRMCQIPHPSFEARNRHNNLWHEPRDTWTCPAISPATGLASFFECHEDEGGKAIDTCLGCYEHIPRPEELDETSHLQHLWEIHNMGECTCRERYFTKEQFTLHLANTHNIYLDSIKLFLVSCKLQEGKTPAFMAGVTSV